MAFLIRGGLILAIVCHSTWAYAAPFPQGEAPDGTKYKTAYRCEDEELHISCDSGETISVIRANYGRFSIAICNKHGFTDWSVNCMSPRTTRVLQNKCDQKQECRMPVNSDVFGDPCPGTNKYVEVHFACAHRVLATTTKRPLPPWFLQGGADNLWSNPKLNPTSTTTLTSSASSTSTTSEEKRGSSASNIFSISASNQDLTDIQRRPILVTSELTTTTPVRIPITTPRPTSSTGTTSSNTKSTTKTSRSSTPKTSSTTASSSSRSTTTTSTGELFSHESITDEVNHYEIEVTESNSLQKPVEVVVENDNSVSRKNRDGYCFPTRARNLQWDWTLAGETAILPCPLGTTGLSRWTCLDSGLWSDNHPDMSDCKSEAATNLEARVRAEDPEAVLASSLAHMTSSQSQFYGGDLDTSVAVMRTLGNRLRFILQTGLHRGRDRGQIYNKEAFVQEVAANIIRTVSNLMSENKSMAWLDLKVPLRMKLINHLLLALEEVAFMLAEVTETPEFLEEVAENLVLAISVLEDQSLDNLQLDPSFPLKLRQTQFGRILNKIRLPDQVLRENAYRGLIKSVFFEYKTLHNLLWSAEKYIPREDISDYVINSRVVSASLSQGRHIQLPKNVEITFQHLTPNLTDPVCVFWNFELPGWSDSGCWVTKTNVSSTTCECEHLTNFAVIMKKSSSDRNVISAKLGPTTVFVLEIVTYVAVALSIVFIFIILYKYHGKLVKLWDKYNCSSKDKAKQGCPKSQSFYAATPHHSGLAGNLNNLVHVSHNPETNLTTTNVASPQTPKTHTLSTESSRLSQQYGLNQVVCNDIMTGHAPTSLPTVGPSGSSRSFLTLQGQSGPGHVTLNPYHYYHHQEADDLHDGLAATLHLRDSVYMSPHLVRLTNTLRSKKKMMCQGAHPDQMVGGSNNPIPNAGCENGNLNFPATSNHDEVVFRAVSPHGHVYWEIDPSRNVSERIKPLESIPNPGGSLLEQCYQNGTVETQEPLYNGSRQSSSRYSDNHPLIGSSNEGSTSVLVNPFADVQLLPVPSQQPSSSVTSSPLHNLNLKPEHRFSSLRGFSQQLMSSQNHYSPASKLFTNRSNSARAAKMRDIAKQIEHMRIVQQHKDSTTSGGSTITSGSTINTNSGSSGGSNSPTTGVPEQLQQQIQIRDLKSIPVSVSNTNDHILAKIQNTTTTSVMNVEENNGGLLNRSSPKQRKV